MKTETVIQGAVALTVIGLGAFAVWKLGGLGKGLLTGDNALTNSATDADGNKVTAYQGVPVVVTYHPAYLLRNLPDKAKAWADLCLALELMDGQAG